MNTSVPLIVSIIIPQCDTASVVKSLMEWLSGECDNRSRISHQCDTAGQCVIWPWKEPKRHF